MLKLKSKSVFIAASVFAALVFSASYFNFARYKPKALQEVREVRGYQTEEISIFDLPIPRYAQGLGNDQTLNSKKHTFQTDRSPQEIEKFYKNILLEDEWKLKKEGSTETFYTAEYHKDEYAVIIWASYDEDVKMTFASVEILRFED